MVYPLATQVVGQFYDYRPVFAYVTGFFSTRSYRHPRQFKLDGGVLLFGTHSDIRFPQGTPLVFEQMKFLGRDRRL